MAVLILVGAIVSVLLVIILLIGIYQKNTNAICISKKRLDGKTVIVTGGTLGMGLEIATDFALRGARVIIACPFKAEGLRAQKTIIETSDNQNIVFKLLDLSSYESTRKFAADILKTEDRLDILVNNAGVGGPRDLVTVDGMNFIMQVNYFGTFLLTMLLLPLLTKTGRPGEPGRILNTASILHWAGRVNFDNLNAHYFTIQVYGNSKLHIVQFTRELTQRLKGFNVVVNNVDPGAVGTGIFLGVHKYFGSILTVLCWILFKTPFQGAQTALHVALDKKAGEVSGEYFKNCALSRAKSSAYNEKLSKMLWEETVRMVKLTDEEISHCFKS